MAPDPSQPPPAVCDDPVRLPYVLLSVHSMGRSVHCAVRRGGGRVAGRTRCGARARGWRACPCCVSLPQRTGCLRLSCHKRPRRAGSTRPRPTTNGWRPGGGAPQHRQDAVTERAHPHTIWVGGRHANRAASWRGGGRRRWRRGGGAEARAVAAGECGLLWYSKVL